MTDEKKTTREEPRATFECCGCMDTMPRIVSRIMSRMMTVCGCGDEAQNEAEGASGEHGKTQAGMMSRMMAMCGCGDEAKDEAEDASGKYHEETETAHP